MTGPVLIRLGTRGSQLARIQSGIVAEALAARGVPVEVVTIVTSGDRRAADTPWGEGAFVGALQDALLRGDIDLAVHSAKDVPIEGRPGLAIAAFPAREDARDALVLRQGVRDGRSGSVAPEGSIELLATLPAGATLGTDSPRRTGFILAARPDLRVVPLHGNVDTRLRRLDQGEVDALVLAVAGLVRLGRTDRISARLDHSLVPPAPGQGALAVEVRADDPVTKLVVDPLDDAGIRLAVEVEREVLATTGGGCRAPVGAFARTVDGTLDLIAGAVEADGTRRRLVKLDGPASDAFELAGRAGRALLGVGATA
jgi:hydroxymethylbilane synthase